MLASGEVDLREYSGTSDLISNLMIRLLKENDNSENAFDDCFFIAKIIKNLGKLDNFKVLPQIATEINRQFNLDHIGKFSPQFAITKGAIKGYYNMLKQIFKFKNHKLPHLNHSKCKNDIEFIT